MLSEAAARARRPPPNPQLLRWTTWGSLFASLLFYLAIPFFMAPAGIESSAPLISLSLLLGVVGVASAGLSFAAKRLLVTGPVDRGSIEPSSVEGAARLQFGYCVTWILCEAVALSGLVLFFVSHRLELMVPFLGGSALLFVVHAPRARDLKRPFTLEELAAGKGTIG